MAWRAGESHGDVAAARGHLALADVTLRHAPLLPTWSATLNAGVRREVCWTQTATARFTTVLAPHRTKLATDSRTQRMHGLFKPEESKVSAVTIGFWIQDRSHHAGGARGRCGVDDHEPGIRGQRQHFLRRLPGPRLGVDPGTGVASVPVLGGHCRHDDRPDRAGGFLRSLARDWLCRRLADPVRAAAGGARGMGARRRHHFGQQYHHPCS